MVSTRSKKYAFDGVAGKDGTVDSLVERKGKGNSLERDAEEREVVSSVRKTPRGRKRVKSNVGLMEKEREDEVVEKRSGRKGRLKSEVATPRRMKSQQGEEGEEEVEVVTDVEMVEEASVHSGDKATAKKTPAKKNSAKKTPAKKTPAKKTLAEKTSAKKKGSEFVSGGSDETEIVELYTPEKGGDVTEVDKEVAMMSGAVGVDSLRKTPRKKKRSKSVAGEADETGKVSLQTPERKKDLFELLDGEDVIGDGASNGEAVNNTLAQNTSAKETSAEKKVSAGGDVDEADTMATVTPQRKQSMEDVKGVDEEERIRSRASNGNSVKKTSAKKRRSKSVGSELDEANILGLTTSRSEKRKENIKEEEKGIESRATGADSAKKAPAKKISAKKRWSKSVGDEMEKPDTSALYEEVNDEDARESKAASADSAKNTPARKRRSTSVGIDADEVDTTAMHEEVVEEETIGSSAAGAHSAKKTPGKKRRSKSVGDDVNEADTMALLEEVDEEVVTRSKTENTGKNTPAKRRRSKSVGGGDDTNVLVLPTLESRAKEENGEEVNEEMAVGSQAAPVHFLKKTPTKKGQSKFPVGDVDEDDSIGIQTSKSKEEHAESEKDKSDGTEAAALEPVEEGDESDAPEEVTLDVGKAQAKEMRKLEMSAAATMKLLKKRRRKRSRNGDTAANEEIDENVFKRVKQRRVEKIKEAEAAAEQAEKEKPRKVVVKSLTPKASSIQKDGFQVVVLPTNQPTKPTFVNPAAAEFLRSRLRGGRHERVPTSTTIRQNNPSKSVSFC